MGIALGVITTAGLLYFNLVNRPIPAEILVAVNDVSSGTVVRAQDFRIARWTDVDQRALSQYVTAREFALFEGKLLNSDVRSGFPLGKGQIDANTPDGVVSRLQWRSRGLTATILCCRHRPIVWATGCSPMTALTC